MAGVNGNYGGNVRNLKVLSSELSQANSDGMIVAEGVRVAARRTNAGALPGADERQGSGIERPARSSVTNAAGCIKASRAGAPRHRIAWYPVCALGRCVKPDFDTC
jgi:hypothetical protein